MASGLTPLEKLTIRAAVQANKFSDLVDVLYRMGQIIEAQESIPDITAYLAQLDAVAARLAVLQETGAELREAIK